MHVLDRVALLLFDSYWRAKSPGYKDAGVSTIRRSDALLVQGNVIAASHGLE